MTTMNASRCPFCGSHNFYIKDPQDQFEIYEFDLIDGAMRFKAEEEAEGAAPPFDIRGNTEMYCGVCSWHGSLKALK
jgi:hypothetical protein